MQEKPLELRQSNEGKSLLKTRDRWRVVTKSNKNNES